MRNRPYRQCSSAQVSYLDMRGMCAVRGDPGPLSRRSKPAAPKTANPQGATDWPPAWRPTDRHLSTCMDKLATQALACLALARLRTRPWMFQQRGVRAMQRTARRLLTVATSLPNQIETKNGSVPPNARSLCYRRPLLPLACLKTQPL